jgi:hypothetical protein
VEADRRGVGSGKTNNTVSGESRVSGSATA